MAGDSRSGWAPGDDGHLHVDRTSEQPRGIWPWREAEYVVYQETPDGMNVEVLTGWYRNHHDALLAARRLLRHRREGVEPPTEEKKRSWWPF